MAPNKPYKVKVTIGDTIVEIEGEEKGVVAIVNTLSDALRSGKRPADAVGSSTVSPEPSPRSSQIDIRTFFEEKQPSSDVEAAAVAAYFYKYLATPDERKETIDADLLVDSFRLSRRPLLAKAAYTLVNARNAGYLESTGDGSYRLNPVGFNLVEHTLRIGERGSGKKIIRKKSKKKLSRTKKPKTTSRR